MEINFINVRFLIRKRLLIFIMRTFIFLLCTSVFSFSSVNSFSQEKVIIDSDQEVSVHQVFRIIKKQTKYQFVYSEDLFKDAPKVRLKKGVITLEKLLKLILSDSNLDFKLSKNNIIEFQDNNLMLTKENKTQGVQISGIVTDKSGEPLPGASIIEKGTTNGTETDFNGKFSLKVLNQNAVLVVSYLGFTTQEIPINGQTSITVKLIENAASLDEIVVIGYGSQKQTKVSGSIAKVDIDELQDFPTSNFDQALAGKMAGVQVLQTTGEPGRELSIKIRGTSTLTAGAEPLYVVDGVPIEDSGKATEIVNMEDIASIQVLKDAASAAIYGSRGGNGVVIITTKKGKKGKMRVNFNHSSGFQKLSKKIDMMDAYQYAELSKEGHDAAYLQEVPTGDSNDPNSVRPAGYHKIPEELFPYLNGEKGLTNTDWQDQIYRSSQIQRYNLSISGGNEKMTYFISANHSKQEGIIINSDYQKTGLRANIGVTSGKFKIGLNLVPSFTVENRVNANDAWHRNGVVQAALAYSPTWPVYNLDGSFNYQGNGFWRTPVDYQHNEIVNPVALATLTKNEILHNNILGNLFVEYELLDYLKLKSSFSANYNNYKNEFYLPKELETRGRNNFGRLSNPSARFTDVNIYNWTVENTINYKRSIQYHNFDFLGGITAQKRSSNTHRTEASVTFDTPVKNANQVLNADQETRNSDIDLQEWSLYSLLARMQYDFAGKYLLSASFRADASSRFGTDSKWGRFPSASVGWRISQEEFLKELNWIDELKIRASYGSTGNFNIGNYEQIPAINSDPYVIGVPGQIQTGFRPTQIANPDLSWETTEMTNVGIDIELFNRQLGFSIEYYNANTSDLLLEVPVPEITGFTSALQNIGEVNNKGLEFTMNLAPDLGGSFKWTSNVNLSINRNEVVALGPNNTDIITTDAGNTFFLTRVGEPIGSYYLLVQDGIFSTQEELDQYPHFENTQVGDFRFVDVDGDGILDPSADRAIVGNFAPDFTYGFSNGFKYKGVDLNIAFQGSYGGEILNLSRRYLAAGEGNFNNTTELLNRWRSEAEPGDGNTNRANRKASGNNARGSSFHVEDGSYLRLQNVSLGYSLPQSVIEKSNISKLRIFLTGNNIHTWTDYTGYNPEVNLRSGSQLAPGVDYGVYPLATTYSLGVNVSF
jgi:TonB-linked SusC/RagA family outer membrane protein